MAWTYSDWRSQSSITGQRDRLRLHLQEIEDKITADVAAHGYSRANHPLVAMVQHLEGKLDKLEAAVAHNGGVTLARIRRPGASTVESE